MQSSRYRLRSADADIALSPGRFFIGRDRDCQLVVDDPVVSRRHALLVIGPGGVTVEDLGSRNGVLVNGDRIEGRVQLEAGDVLTIGLSQLTLQRATRIREAKQTVGQVRSSGAYRRPPATMRPPASPVPARPSDDAVPPLAVEATRETSVFGMLVSACETALERGDLRGAESSAGNLVVSMRAEILRGRVPAPVVWDDLVGFCLRLAEDTGRVRWIDRLFEVYGSAGRVLPLETIGRIHGMVLRHGFVIDQALAAYVSRLQRRADQLDQDEYQRLVRLSELAHPA